MILKVIGYGNPILRNQSKDIDFSYPDLNILIENMFETLKVSNAVGLSAPQIGLNINLFVLDNNNIKKIFINPEILETSDEEVAYDEGCLSLPDVDLEIYRKEKVLINYFDENFENHEEWFDGYTARIIQHEYDHLNGRLFIDHVTYLKKTLIKNKLNNIINGKVKVNYPMRFYINK